VARNSAFYTPYGRFNLSGAKYKRDFGPLQEGCDCYACANYSRAYIHHLFKAKEMVSATLISIHNERFVVKMVDDARLVVSEPLGDLYGAWREVPESTCVVVHGGREELRPFVPAEPAKAA